MAFELTNLIISILTLIGLGIYAYFTYLIARDVYTPFVSFTLKQIKFTHLGFSMVNKSKVEVQVFGKLWAKVNNERFEFDGGFYGDKTPWILQPFTEGFGHFYLKDTTNKEGIKLEDFVKKNKTSSVNFNMQIKYRKVGSKKWIKTSPQNFAYNFDKNLFWLNV